MSHGHNNGQVCAVDREFIVKPTIIDPIMKNESLNGIPKIFIIVACRGSGEYLTCDTLKCRSGMNEMDREIDGLIDGRFSGAAGIAPYLISYSTLEGIFVTIFLFSIWSEKIFTVFDVRLNNRV